jgi:hypothetical protein
VNAAILLLATCVSDAHPIISTSECASCAVVSDSCGGCGFWTWFWGKKKECGHHIHCPHPGPIPGMEHPTLKQRIKDWLCPHRCTPPDSQTCGEGCAAPTILVPPGAEPLMMPSISAKPSNPERLRVMPGRGQPTIPVQALDPNERPY